MYSFRLKSLSKLLPRKTAIQSVPSHNYSTSTQPAVTSPQQDYEKQLKDFNTLKNITRKPRTKKPQRAPFMKELLIGNFDTEILTYPQLDRKEEVEEIQVDAQTVQKLLGQNHMVNCTSLGDKNFRQNLADYKMIGLQASQYINGRECGISETMRYLEALSEHSLRDSIITHEQLSVQTLNKYANEMLKQKYLPRIMAGESLAAMCLSEAHVTDITGFGTKADLSSDGKSWVLNGEKTMVINGVSADVLIVFAVTNVIKRDVEEDKRITAFVIEKDSPGVSFVKNDSTSVETASIRFENTTIPNENVIGEVDKGVDILNEIILDYRLSIGPPCITLTKKILNTLSNEIIRKSDDVNLIYKTDAVRSIIAKITSSIFAMESATYLTSGLLDSFENQDCQMESSIVKVFCSEKLWEASNLCLDLTGTVAISDSHFANKYHKEALPFVSLHDPNDSLKIIIALLGLQHAGVSLNEKIHKIRNPLYFSAFAFKRFFTGRRNDDDDPKLDLELQEYLHPTCYKASKNLEYCVKRLEFATEIMLGRYGPAVINYHMDLRRYAECIIDTYILVACLGRASRSYCIGLRNADCEMLVADTISFNTKQKVQYLVKEIHGGHYATNDENYRQIAKRVFKAKEYALEHPLKRNF
ncbi:unnamed protein product [Acanthoscelides obtectus]|uniref:Acyl-CoA dehydrogenase family member 9, mitochondrial n=1 Tax=Acanthoscelides obtectus TaxID=200917 RepID=A0A9P0JW46_ACAOB|nr:unnamed protein product [Acanthoscelides obtectus]CAK1625208.1 Acyl-CoA dehydrogenase family member 9, mitochondrial [Acanthoscelides obtectus]